MYKLALINETECIGCTKCIQACPFDAIIGAQKQLHTVLNTECTGCGLCVDPCPVDCISMHNIEKPLFDRDRVKQQRRRRRERLEKFADIPEDSTSAKKELLAALQRIRRA